MKPPQSTQRQAAGALVGGHHHFHHYWMSVVFFGPYMFDSSGHRLYRRGARIDLPRQPARVLEMLLAKRGQVVTRDQLREGLWGDRVVEFDTGLNYCMHQLRKKLEDDSRSPTYIETVAGDGYRFIASVHSRSARAVRRAATLTAVSVPFLLSWLFWPSNRTPTSPVSAGPTIAIELDESATNAVSGRLIQEIRTTMDSALAPWRVPDESPSHLISVTPEPSRADTLDPIAWVFRFMALPQGDTLFAGTVRSRGLPADEISAHVAKGVREAIEAFFGGFEPGIHQIQRSSIPAAHLPKHDIGTTKTN